MEWIEFQLSYCSIQDTGGLVLVHWDDPEGWYREGGGSGVQDGEHMYTCGGFMLMYGKTSTKLQSKNNNNNNIMKQKSRRGGINTEKNYTNISS